MDYQPFTPVGSVGLQGWQEGRVGSAGWAGAASLGCWGEGSWGVWKPLESLQQWAVGALELLHEQMLSERRGREVRVGNAAPQTRGGAPWE